MLKNRIADETWPTPVTKRRRLQAWKQSDTFNPAKPQARGEVITPAMKKVYCIGLAIIFALYPGVLIYAEDIPDMEKCDLIILRSSEGWWLRINKDESGAYGFGVQLDRVEVKQDTFDFRQVYTVTRMTSADTRANAEGAYIAVSYYVPGSSAAREYYLMQDRQWLANLISAARNNAVAPVNEFEQRAHDRIEVFWDNSPYLAANKREDNVDGE